MNKQELLTVKAFSGNITELFSEEKTGKDKQGHTDRFVNLLRSIVTKKIETPKVRVKRFYLKRKISDFDILHLIGSKAVFKTKEQALVVLHASMIDKYRDGKANIVYYLDENDELCTACCYWFDGEWYCGAGFTKGEWWSVHSRVFYLVND